jgi:hypothetical protein
VAEPSPSIAPEPSGDEQQTAAAIASELADENLRKTVQKAIGFSLARHRSDHPV